MYNTGIRIDDDGRVLVYYRDEFGKLRSKHLMYVTGTRVEFRHHTTVVIGTVIEEEGKRFIRIDL